MALRWMPRRWTAIRCMVALAGAALLPASGMAQYPEKPVRFVTPFPAGSVTDIIARPIAARLGETWGQPVLVDNRSGAAGIPGAEAVARAAPDGYTLLVGTNASNAINAALYKTLPYDPARDFAPITLVATSYLLLVANTGVKAQSVKELVALAKATGQISYGSAGSGSSPHLAGELFKSMAGINMLHVPYKGSPQILVDLLAGRIDVYFSNAAAALPQVKAGKLRLLAVTSARRDPAMPDVPTVSEAGMSGYEATSWFGFYAPAKTAPELINRLAAEITRVVALPDTAKVFQASALTPATSTPAEFAAFNRREIEKWTQVVRASGATVE